MDQQRPPIEKQAASNTLASKPRFVAQMRLAQELLDALWLEDFNGFRQQCADCDLMGIKIRLDEANFLYVPGVWCERERPLKLTAWPVWLNEHGRFKAVRLDEMVVCLQQADWWQGHADSEYLPAQLMLATEQLTTFLAKEAQLLERFQHSQVALQDWEALCCLRDRPFHPLSHAKQGWSQTDESHYGCFAEKAVQLNWVGVPKSQRLNSADVMFESDKGYQPIEDIARLILSAQHYSALQQALEKNGLDPLHYCAMPVHPWQWRWLNEAQQRQARPWLTHCVVLRAEDGRRLTVGEGVATASLRSLILKGQAHRHLKLSCSVVALGATRTQPARYLQNGVYAQQVLHTLCARDSWLEKHLWLCDERDWGVLASSAEVKPDGWQRTDHEWITKSWQDETGEISYLLRVFPESLINDHQVALVPMAACAVLSSDTVAVAWDWLLAHSKEADTSSEAALALFKQVTDVIVQLGMRCFRYGVMPEIHGQNVLLVFRAGVLQGVLLRDHDTLRICPEIMRDQHLTPPRYLINRRSPNTLVLSEAHELFSYMQTLALQVNLYSIAAVLAQAYAIDESCFWRIIDNSLYQHLDVFDDVPALANIVVSCLQSKKWPFKQLLTPLLANKTDSSATSRDSAVKCLAVNTGMPSATGLIDNPLLRWGAGSRTASAKPTTSNECS